MNTHAIPKNSCSKGHELTPENTYVGTRGDRVCRECQRDHQRTYAAKNREALQTKALTRYYQKEKELRRGRNLARPPVARKVVVITPSKQQPKVSPEDECLLAFRWRPCKHGYLRRNLPRQEHNGKQGPRFAHHDVCLRAFGRMPDWKNREVCDHINRDTSDNRRENLRIVTVRENNANRAPKEEQA